MSVTKASLWRRAALTLAAGVAIALPTGAKADEYGGLSVRAGGFFPVRGSIRDVTDFAAWGLGVDYKANFIPHVLNGEHWASSISADFYYSERSAGILRYIPVAINQIYTFEGQNGHAPYAGFSLIAATFGGSVNGPGGGHVATVTRAGLGLILGVNVDKHFYVEGRYDWIDAHHLAATPEGFRAMVGFRF